MAPTATTQVELANALTLAVQASWQGSSESGTGSAQLESRLEFIGRHLLAQAEGSALPIAGKLLTAKPSEAALKELAAKLTAIVNTASKRKGTPEWPLRAVAAQLVDAAAAAAAPAPSSQAEPAGAASFVPPQVQAAFDGLDRDANRELSIREVAIGLKKLGMEIPPADVGAVFNAFDQDKNFRLSIAEFYNLYRKLRERAASIVPAAPTPTPFQLPPDVQAAYSELFDTNADGTLTVSEVHAGLSRLGIHIPRAEMANVFRGFDTDQSFRLEPAEVRRPPAPHCPRLASGTGRPRLWYR